MEQKEFITKYHTTRTEYFEPPLTLNKRERYNFTSKKGAKMSILNFEGREWWVCYVGTHTKCNTYEQAVELAKKYFLGEK